MRLKNIFLFACLLGLGTTLSAQVIGKATKGAFLLKNATLETITNGSITGDLLIENGKITGIGTEVAAPAGAKTIDCTDKYVYPGFIDAGTSLGTVEVSSVSLTRDNNEIGDIKPHLHALTAVNPSSVAIPVTRVSGVTTVITKPVGGVIPGTAALINLVGYSPDEMYADFSAVCLNFPSGAARGRWDRRSDEDRKKEKEKKLKTLTDLWDETKLFAKIWDAKQKDASIRQDLYSQLEAMVPVIKGEMPLFVEVNRDQDILSAIEWIQENEIKAVLTGVAEGWRVAKEIAESGIPVITGPVINIPTRGSDRYDRAYTNPAMLKKAGVTVAIRSNDTENVRDLPFHAGFAAAYGLGREEALKAITIVPAQIMGLDEAYGSLEVGKMANLFICDGDPLETKTQIEQVFIQGWEIPMNSRHSLLYEEFLERSPGVKN
ncbi:MAG: amidohydrolase family protein [Bacteroidota bacterium]